MPLMTFEEYKNIKKHNIPYFYIIKFGDNFLYYFGEKHSFDFQDGQWVVMKNFWSDFLENTINKKRIVFIESGKPVIKETEEKAIREGGGSGLATFLASKENIGVICPEPNMSYQFSELEKYFKHEEIEYYFFARTVAQWHRNNPKPDFKKYIQSFLDRDKKASGWDDIDFTVEGMEKIHKNIFNTEFNQEDRNFFVETASPVKLKTVVNKVNRRCSDIRNLYIIEQIKKYTDEGYSIFLEYGAAHAVMQEPLLRETL